MLLGNAQLEAVYGEAQDRYGRRLAGAILWHGRVACRVIDRVRTVVSPGGGTDSLHETIIWLPAGLIADDGTALALQADYTMDVREDGVLTRYVVNDWSDFGQRILGSPSDVKVYVERRPA